MMTTLKAVTQLTDDGILPLHSVLESRWGDDTCGALPQNAEVLVLSKSRGGFAKPELAQFRETVEAAVSGQFPKARYLVLDLKASAPDTGCASAEFNQLAASIESLVTKSSLIAVACVRGQIGGADLELALACNMIVADANTQFCFAGDQGGVGLYGSLALKLGYVFAERILEQGLTLNAEQMKERLLVRETLDLANGLDPLWRFLGRTSRRHNASWSIFRAQRLAAPSVYAALQ